MDLTERLSSHGDYNRSLMARGTLLDILSVRLRAALALLALVLAAGTAGYMTIAHLSFIDALYQTVTTVSTVGFREVKPFNTLEKLFTIVLILVGVGTMLYTVTLAFAQVLEGDIRSRFYERKMSMQIAELSGHYVLCGFGRVGQEIARELRERNAPFVVIESNPEQAARARAFGYMVLVGDAADEQVLTQANLSRARCLLAAADSDAGNTYITLTAKAVNPGCFVVARVAFPHNESKLRMAGADRVLSLYSMGGRRMVLSALQPLAADFMDTLASGRSGDLVLAEFEATITNGLAGKTAGELVHGAHNATLLGVRKPAGGLVVGPREDIVLGDGDVVIVLAEEADIAAFRSPAV